MRNPKVLALLTATLAAWALPDRESRPVAWTDLTGTTGQLVIVRAERRLFRQRSQLVHYLEDAESKHPAPRVDFAARQLLLVSPGPRSSTGYGVQVLSARERDGKITIRVRERAPSLDDHVKPHVTYPYRLLSLPADKSVFVDWVGR